MHPKEDDLAELIPLVKIHAGDVATPETVKLGDS